ASYFGCTDQLWSWDVQDCGVDGQDCKPFTNQSFVFRCPSMCAITYNFNTRWLGPNVTGNGVPWVVGSNPYRAESWICPTAIHGGVVSQIWGGCGVLTVVGEESSFPASTENGITSLGFPSWFPKAYTITAVGSQHCSDLTWAMLPVAMCFVGLFSLVSPSSAAFYFALVTAGFWNVIFFNIPNHDDGWVSAAFGTYIVAVAFAVVMYRFVVHHSMLVPRRFPIDTFLLTVLPFYLALYIDSWTAPLSNFGFSSRAFRDPVTLATFIVLVPALLIACAIQLFLFRRHGLIGPYLIAYGLGIAVYFTIPALLSLDIHLHHYLVGIVLLPLTKLQSRPSLLAQGFLLGLMVQGVARWGPASPFETRFQALNGEPAGTPQPTFAFDPAALARTGNISWTFSLAGYPGELTPGGAIPPGLPYDSFSLLMNDVEVYRGPQSSFSVARIHADPNGTLPFYVRVALVESGTAQDYTDPVEVRGNG
ncbi:hypothetical protein BDK51DRAFT_9167, partial [Blyttiomyces helicus]